MTTKVSVVIASYGINEPGYARGPLLDRALYTYSKQTMSMKEWEYLIVDDGSTDNTAAVIKKWQKKGLPIKSFTAEDIGKPKIPGEWRDGCALRNAVSTFANGQVLVSSHPEIMIPPNALDIMYGEVMRNALQFNDVFVTAIPFWLPNQSPDQVKWKKNLYELSKLEGFFDPSWPDPLHSPGAVDYRNQNQMTRTTWESEVFWAMSMELWRRMGGFREFKVWGSVDIDFMNQRNRHGVRTVLANAQEGPHDKGTLMVYHQWHESKRDMDKTMAALRDIKNTPGGLAAIYRHGPRERPVHAEQAMGDHWSRYNFANTYAHNKDILDVPCGTGYGGAIMTNARTYIGVDIDEESVYHAERHFGAHNRKYISGDMADLSEIPDTSIDMVVCFEGLEHIPMESKHKFFEEMHRVLRPGGTFIVSTPQSGATPGTPWDRYMLTFEQLTALVHIGKYFTNIDWYFQTHYGSRQDPQKGFPPRTAEIMIVGGQKV